MNCRRTTRLKAGIFLLAILTISLLSARGFVINATFDSTITSDPQAATIEATIYLAIAAYESNLSDSVTANITFAEMSGGLGENESYTTSISYSTYRANLASHSKSTDDATALASLPTGSANPVNGSTSITLKLPLARALGHNVNPPTGQPDGTVYLNTSIMNLSSSQSNPNNYSLFATVSHEMDEVIGFGSALNNLTNGAPAPTGAVMPQDLFRYDQTGARSFTTDVNAQAFFSFDGTNDLVQFNQEQGGDFGDWYSYPYGAATPRVQDAFAKPGIFPVLGVELRGLDAIGFTLFQKTDQTITFGALTNKTIGEPPFAVRATASSGLPVSFSIASGPATISGSNVTLTGTGAVTVQASQAGNSNYNAATNVNQTFTVYLPPTIGRALSGKNFILTWPTNVPGYTLQSASNLVPVVNWTNVSPAPAIANGVYTVTNKATNSKTFYRLIK